MSSPINLSQFRQWLVKHQEQLRKNMLHEHRKAQESLERDLCETFKGAQPGSPGGEVRGGPSYYHLSKLTKGEDIEAFVFCVWSNDHSHPLAASTMSYNPRPLADRSGPGHPENHASPRDVGLCKGKGCHTRTLHSNGGDPEASVSRATL